MEEYDLTDVAQQLAKVAGSAYTLAADGFYDAVSIKPIPDATPSLCETYELAFPYGGIIPQDFEDLMQNSGFVSYACLGGGDNADVMRAYHDNGHHYALRLDKRFADRRIISPVLPQPFMTYDNEDVTDIKIEVLPEVRMLRLRDLFEADQDHYDLTLTQQKILETVMPKFLAAARNKNHLDLKDTAIYPDGTFVFVDPGQVDYVSEQMRKEPGLIIKGLTYLHELSSDPAIPEQFKWFAKDRRWKQDVFFVNPFERSPQYRGFAPLRQTV